MNLLEVEQGLTFNRPPVEAPATIVEFMPEGYAIEKNPTPLATMVIPASPTESIVLASPQLSPQPESDTAVLGEDRDAVAALILNGNVIRPIEDSVESATSLSEESPDAPEKNGLGKNMLLAARRSKLGIFAATAAVTAAGLFSANTETANAEPVSIASGNVPTLGSATLSEASASDALIQDCVDKELVKPQVEKAEIRSPGTANQTTNINMEVDATPEECRGVVSRFLQYEVIVKQTIPVHGKLKRVTTRLARFNGNYYQREVAGPFGASYVPNPHNSRESIRPCSPGAAKTTARLKIRGVISNAVTQEEEARKLWWGPIDLKRKKVC